MRNYEIREDGVKIATIEARTAESALKKAAKRFPRRACDYNGYTGTVVWRAFAVGGASQYAAASLEVEVSP